MKDKKIITKHLTDKNSKGELKELRLAVSLVNEPPEEILMPEQIPKTRRK